MFPFIDAFHLIHIMIEVIANKSSLRVTCSNVHTITVLFNLMGAPSHWIVLYNVAFVDKYVDTKELLISLVENVVTNRLLIILLKTLTAIHVWRNKVVWIYSNNYIDIDFNFFIHIIFVDRITLINFMPCIRKEIEYRIMQIIVVDYAMLVGIQRCLYLLHVHFSYVY